MGESSARRIRGGEMDDAIFAGAGNRPPRNAAEVSVVVETAENDDAAEREIARRIERGAGSHYRIDGRDARARDVQLLFADAATGANSTALVSQGGIGALIGARPEERRRLLEDAAGIAGLHGRRREAESRLRAAEANLERLEDVIAARREHLQGLERQARQAARYRSLSARLRQAEAALHWRRWALADAELRRAGEDMATAAHAEAARNAEAERVAAARDAAAQALPPLREADKAAGAALQRIEIARETLRGDARRAHDAAGAARAQLDAAETDAAREAQLAAEAEAALARGAEETAALGARQVAESALRSAAEAELAAVRRRAERAETAATAASDALAAAAAQREALVRRIDALDRRAATLEKRAASAARETAAAGANPEGRDQRGAEEAALAAAGGRARAAAEERENRRAAAARAVRVRDAAQAEDRARRDETRDAAVAHERAVAEHDALAELLAVEGARPLLDRMTVPEEFALAVAAALGDDLLAGDDPGDAAHWRAPPARGGPPLPPETTALSALAQAPEILRPRLAQIGLAASRADGAALQSALAQGQRLVSREGDLWRWDGYTASADAEGGAAARLARRGRLTRLARACDAAGERRAAADERAARAAAALDTAAAEANRARAAENHATRTARAAARELEAARERRDAAAAARAEARARLAALRENAAGLRRDHGETLAERAAAARMLAELPAAAALRAMAAAARNANRAARNDADAATRRAAEFARAAQARAARLAALERDRANWRRRLEAAAERSRALGERRTALAARLDELRALPDRLRERAAALDADSAAARGARAEAAKTLAESEARAADAARARDRAGEALARSREDAVRAEGRRDRARAMTAAAAARIAESFAGGPGEAERIAGAAAGERGVEELEARAARLRRERERMGAVNLRAEIEAAEREAEIAGMTRERDDVAAAVTRLRGALEALNREGRERLEAAFNAVNGHFRALFARLFGGGRAELTLTGGDDPLQAGLDIAASLPGKRTRTLSLLSGGEKALAALALIFAVFRARPAPICVLDEADAPLDDANVARFCDLLNDIAQETQTRFLVITHHRLTMARMNRLYGVTMSERGVSQLVSVDLGEAEAAARAPGPQAA